MAIPGKTIRFKIEMSDKDGAKLSLPDDVFNDFIYQIGKLKFLGAGVRSSNYWYRGNHQLPGTNKTNKPVIKTKSVGWSSIYFDWVPGLSESPFRTAAIPEWIDPNKYYGFKGLLMYAPEDIKRIQEKRKHSNCQAFSWFVLNTKACENEGIIIVSPGDELTEWAHIIKGNANFYTVEAICKPERFPTDHVAHLGFPAPHPTCNCGIHLSYDYIEPLAYCDVMEPQKGCLGLIEFGGKVEVHEIGVRAEKARLVATVTIAPMGWSELVIQHLSSIPTIPLSSAYYVVTGTRQRLIAKQEAQNELGKT